MRSSKQIFLVLGIAEIASGRSDSARSGPGAGDVDRRSGPAARLGRTYRGGSRRSVPGTQGNLVGLRVATYDQTIRFHMIVVKRPEAATAVTQPLPSTQPWWIHPPSSRYVSSMSTHTSPNRRDRVWNQEMPTLRSL
jgi:hypothetical protein